jgi:hypothetical protein
VLEQHSARLKGVPKRVSPWLFFGLCLDLDLKGFACVFYFLFSVFQK